MSINNVVADWLTKRVSDPKPLADIHELNSVLRYLAKWRSQLLANTYVGHHGRTVFQGPFAGMAYVSQATEGALIARLLGTYESELHPHIAGFSGENLDCIIDIGCAEGYYAVGLARLMPQVQVFAYDIDLRARQACKAMAETNDVHDRIVIREHFEPTAFDEFAGRRCLVFVDAEGAEDDLLDPSASSPLADMNLIVETHDGARPGVLKRLIARFEPTHDIVQVNQSGKVADLPDWLAGLGHLDQLLAVWEWRSTPTPWLIMRPKGVQGLQRAIVRSGD